MAKVKKESHSSNLLNALKFVGMSGVEYCSISNGQISAFTDQVALGFPIEEDLNAQAHIKNLFQSLLKSNEKTAITQLDLHKLHVNSGELQVYIPCTEKINHVKPDESSIEISKTFISAIETLLPLVSSFGEHVSLKTILSNNRSFFATNRFIMVEYWHGLNLPFCNMSKKFLQIVLKSKKDVAGFGYSANSVTVHFKDGSWIMGRSSSEQWQNPYQILDGEFNYKPISVEFVNALRSVPDFSDSGMVHFGLGCLQSHSEPGEGASMPVPELAPGSIFGVKEMEFVLKNAVQCDLSNPNVFRFIGQNIRGAVASRKI